MFPLSCGLLVTGACLIAGANERTPSEHGGPLVQHPSIKRSSGDSEELSPRPTNTHSRVPWILVWIIGGIEIFRKALTDFLLARKEWQTRSFCCVLLPVGRLWDRGGCTGRRCRGHTCPRNSGCIQAKSPPYFHEGRRTPGLRLQRKGSR